MPKCIGDVAKSGPCNAVVGVPGWCVRCRRALRVEQSRKLVRTAKSTLQRALAIASTAGEGFDVKDLNKAFTRIDRRLTRRLKRLTNNA